MQRGNVSALGVMDLSAAFNMVDHKILLSVLEKKFGIRDVALKWFREYLQPRFFQSVCNNAYSNDREITFSVPQGSINSPILFNSHSSTIRSGNRQGHNCKCYCRWPLSPERIQTTANNRDMDH